MSKTAIIYARVSTPGQADEELPVESQLEACRRKAAELGLEVMREFVDAGISGRTDDRPAFRDALAFCKSNKVTHFLCWNTSRFAREHIDAGWHKRQLNKSGTTMLYVSMNLDTSTKEGWMMESFLAVIDEYYSRQISDDTRRSMMKNARDGHFNGGNIPYGYRVVRDGKRARLEIVESEAAIVREIFNDAGAGAGAMQITMSLNDRGLRRRGVPWSKNTVGNLLRNWAMCGYIVFNRRAHHARETKDPSEWIKIKGHPAIVEEEKFMIVQRAISSRAPAPGRGSPRSAHIFTGMLKCGSCGAAMMIETATGRSARYSYYNCGNAMRGTGCRSRRLRADEFDPWMADYIITRVMSFDNLKSIATEIERAAASWSKEHAARRSALAAELRDVVGRRRKLYDLMETTEKEALNLGDLKPRLVEMNAQARRLEASIAEMDRAQAPSAVGDVALAELQAFVRHVVLQSNQPKRVREFFFGFIDEIVVLDTEVQINYRKDRIVTANATDSVHSRSGWLPDLGLLRTGRVVVGLPDRWRRAA